MTWDGKKVTIARNQVGMTQKFLAMRLNLSPEFVSNWERNIRPVPEKYYPALDVIFPDFGNGHVRIEIDKLRFIMRTLGTVKSTMNAIYKIPDCNEKIDKSLDMIGEVLK